MLLNIGIILYLQSLVPLDLKKEFYAWAEYGMADTGEGNFNRLHKFKSAELVGSGELPSHAMHPQ